MKITIEDIKAMREGLLIFMHLYLLLVIVNNQLVDSLVIMGMKEEMISHVVKKFLLLYFSYFALSWVQLPFSFILLRDSFSFWFEESNQLANLLRITVGTF